MEMCMQRERHARMKAEIKGMYLQAKERQRSPANPPEARIEAWNRFSLRTSEGINPAHSTILDFQAPELWDNTFLLFKYP